MLYRLFSFETGLDVSVALGLVLRNLPPGLGLLLGPLDSRYMTARISVMLAELQYGSTAICA